VKRFAVAVTLAGLACVTTLTAAATTTRPLPTSNLMTRAGRPTPLRAGVAYTASPSFPIGVRLVPQSGWSGAQWRTGLGPGRVGRAKPPFYGWFGLLRGSRTTPPLGAITVMTAYARTPAPSAVANRLRTSGRGATYGPVSTVTVGGFSGSQFDGQVVGVRHFFIPFSRTSKNARYYSDGFDLDKGGVFRVIVLNVRGRAIIIYVDKAALPAARFSAFLSGPAAALLKSLTFTG
jgi:hypothetical protein